MLEYAWNHAIISDRVYNDVNNNCEFTKKNLSSSCNKALTQYFNEYRLIDIYNLYAPICVDNQTNTHNRNTHAISPRLFSKFVSPYSRFLFWLFFLLYRLIHEFTIS